MQDLLFFNIYVHVQEYGYYLIPKLYCRVDIYSNVIFLHFYSKELRKATCRLHRLSVRKLVPGADPM
jgi:hypothetical protein